MKSITKKLKNEIFIWDPNAYQGKGYWFVLGTKGGMGRAASANEAKRLGKPEKKEIDPVSPKVAEPDKKVKLPKNAAKKRPDWAYGRRREAGEESIFAEAQALKERSFGSLAAERMMSGQGLLGSLKGAAGDKLGAMGTRIKGKFKAASIGTAIAGPLGGTLLGKAFKNRKEDIEHFTGVSARESKGKGVTASKIEPVPSIAQEESSGSVLDRIYKVLIDEFEYIKKRDDKFSDANRISQSTSEREKIDFNNPTAKKEEKEDKKGLMGLIAGVLGALGAGLSGIFGKFGGALGSLMGGGLKLGGKALAGIASLVGSALGGIRKKSIPEVSKIEPPAGKINPVSTSNKTLQTAEKAGAELAKDASTASKAAGGASKLAKGGAKLLGFLKSVPGLSTIAAGADLIMRVSDINSKLEAGEIQQSEYRKEITKAIGGAAAAGLLPVLGAGLGSVIPGVGTLAGGLVGAGAAILGGDKIGEYLGEKAYDYFVENKQSPQSSSTEMLTDAMGNAVPTATPAITSSGSPSIPSTVSPGAAEVPVSPLGPRLNSAVAASSVLASAATTPQSQAPIIINKTSGAPTIIGEGSGGGTKASLRNEDAVLQRMQYGIMRTV